MVADCRSRAFDAKEKVSGQINGKKQFSGIVLHNLFRAVREPTGPEGRKGIYQSDGWTVRAGPGAIHCYQIADNARNEQPMKAEMKADRNSSSLTAILRQRCPRCRLGRIFRYSIFKDCPECGNAVPIGI